MMFQRGDWPENEFYNDLLGRAKRSRLLAAGVGVEHTSEGLSLKRDPSIWALISGTSPAYGFLEQVPSATGGWTPLTGGRSDDSGRQPAYEANMVAGLAGTYQRLFFSTANDWRFQDIRLGSGGSTGCPLKINFTDCGGNPISGATITIGGSSTLGSGGIITPGVTTLGTTDGSGNYTFPTTGTGSSGGTFTICYDGVCGTFGYSASGSYSCSYVEHICYVHAVVNVTTTAPADTVTFYWDSSITTFFSGATVTTSGDVTTFTFKQIVLCGSLNINGTGWLTACAPGWLCNCVQVTIRCGEGSIFSDGGGDYTIEMFYYEADYVLVPGGYCDLGCQTYGKGPNYRGVIPKKLFATWSSAPADNLGRNFGTLAGVPIELDWNPGTFVWSSGCLPASITCLAGADDASCGSAICVLDLSSTDGWYGTIGIAQPLYIQFFDLVGCVNADPREGACNCYATYIAWTTCLATCPVNATSSISDGIVTYTVHLTE